MTYLFRDTDLAARRLRVLADVFAAASRAFLQAVAARTPQLALDLGCGPGYTTRLLAETTRSGQSIGLDSSAHFVTLARNNNTAEGISFLCHDITQVPFPADQGDLIFCRFLLTHLREPQTIIERWASQLRPQGLMLLEEVEWIQTEHPLFRTYLGIVDALLAHQANQLYIGALLDRQQTPDILKRCLSRIYRLPVSTRQAAAMFAMNCVSWKSQPFIQERYSLAMIEQLEQDLQELAETSTSEGEIEWGLRQIAYRRSL